MAFKKLKYWFDGELAVILAEKIRLVSNEIDSKKFIANVAHGVEPLELKDRVELIADHLFELLNRDYVASMKVLMDILGPENKEETGMFTNYYWLMPVAKLVEKYGLDHFDISMKATEEITKRNTGEYMIRPFIAKYPDKTMEVMKDWSRSANFHVRRLSCEGLRPRLPWASKLDIFISDPRPILSILENLKDDESKYVQKSVANCINDILKDNPKVAIRWVKRWAKNPTDQRRWIIRHALRNLTKAEDKWAISILDILANTPDNPVSRLHQK